MFFNLNLLAALLTNCEVDCLVPWHWLVSAGAAVSALFALALPPPARFRFSVLLPLPTAIMPSFQPATWKFHSSCFGSCFGRPAFPRFSNYQDRRFSPRPPLRQKLVELPPLLSHPASRRCRAERRLTQEAAEGESCGKSFRERPHQAEKSELSG